MADKKQRAKAGRIYTVLKNAYPEAKIALNFTNPLELLVATILSAQCTDVRVNLVTQNLFKKYPTVEAFADAELAELANDIRSTGFFRNKAKNIKNACRLIRDKHHGELPRTMAELTELPGIGRKSANVVLGNAYSVPGIVVDTHVIRLSNRLGLVDGKDPVKIEMRLNELIPRANWILFSHLIVSHGRSVCKARKPLCGQCVIFNDCDNPLI